MIASLPMYDWPETAAVNDRFWQAIRAQLGYGPDQLTRGADLWDQWLSPELLLSQTCGYPYRARLHGKVQLVCAPVFDLPDCPPGHYYSVFVARAADPRSALSEFATAPFAYNEPLSQSGWAAPNNYVQKLGLSLGTPIQSGAHLNSARMVATGAADLASLDAMSWKLIQRHASFSGDLKEIARTDATPAMPYITALGTDPAPLRTAMAAAIAQLPTQDRTCLGLNGVTSANPDAFLAVPNPAPPTSDTA